MDLRKLIEKYSTSGPRYTSYPTAPQWAKTGSISSYKAQLDKLDDGEPLSLYFHLPFCESLCWYCGCNIQIRKDHSRSASYVEAILKEMDHVCSVLKTKRKVDQIAWGGGTPTFLSLSEIKLLSQSIQDRFEVLKTAEVSIEIDPRVTTQEQLELLRELGFNRVSLGVQDFDEKVQKAIHRIQPYSMTANMLNCCRELGFRGINFDLIYGLPYQSIHTFENTLNLVLQLRPDRIAFYNYAHLPNMIPHQKIIDSMPRPSASERVDLFLYAYETFTKNGYVSIGLDHFALATDELYEGMNKGYLYRNFQGYSLKKGANMIGFGASAIGDVSSAFFQNTKDPQEYENEINALGFSIARECLLSQSDRERRWIIQALMCRFQLLFHEFESIFNKNFKDSYSSELLLLAEMEKDGLLVILEDKIKIEALGRLFLRNIAMIFDEYLKKSSAVFSKTV